MRTTEVLTSSYKINMLALGVMVRLASFSSTAVMSASLHAGSRRARQPNKPLGDPDSTEEMIFTSGHSLTGTNTRARTRTCAGQSQTSGFKNAHP